MKLCVYMATHKKQDKYDKSYIKPIQVGADLTDIDLYQLKDNTLDNISNKNKDYCELTALYWIWKNSNYEYVGLCHYRRFFNINKLETMISHLKNGKMIVPQVDSLRISIDKQFCSKHPKSVWNKMLDVLKEKYPDDYLLSKKVFSDNKIIPLNMFIAKKCLFDNYCEWLFDILFEVEKRIDTSNTNENLNRYAGFISERMFILYLKAKNIPLIETQVLDENGVRAIRSKAGKTLNKGHYIKNKIIGRS